MSKRLKPGIYFKPDTLKMVELSTVVAGWQIATDCSGMSWGVPSNSKYYIRAGFIYLGAV